MKIINYPFICPVCHLTGTAFLGECHKPPFDETAPDKRSLLCNVCERWFINALFNSLGEEVMVQSGRAIGGVCLSAMRKEAQVAGEPGATPQVGTDQPSGLPGRVHGMQLDSRDDGVSGRVGSRQEDAHPTLRGPTVLPAELPE